jgi:stringent starvation protein B
MNKSLKQKLLETAIDHIIDSGGKPHIAIHYDSALSLNAVLPEGFDNNNVLVLTIHGNDVCNFIMNDTTMTFDCSFKKVPMTCVVPLASIISMFDPVSNDGVGFNLAQDMSRALSARDTKREKVAAIGLRVVK